MEFKTNVSKNGGSTYLLLPKQIVEYLGLEAGECTAIVEEKDTTGKGRFAVFWSRADEKKAEDAVKQTEQGKKKE